MFFLTRKCKAKVYLMPIFFQLWAIPVFGFSHLPIKSVFVSCWFNHVLKNSCFQGFASGLRSFLSAFISTSQKAICFSSKKQLSKSNWIARTMIVHIKFTYRLEYKTFLYSLADKVIWLNRKFNWIRNASGFFFWLLAASYGYQPVVACFLL